MVRARQIRLVWTDVEPVALEKLHSASRAPVRVVPVRSRSPAGETPVATLYSLDAHARLAVRPPSTRSVKEATRVEKAWCWPVGARCFFSRQRMAREPAAPMGGGVLDREEPAVLSRDGADDGEAVVVGAALEAPADGHLAVLAPDGDVLGEAGRELEDGLEDGADDEADAMDAVGEAEANAPQRRRCRSG